MTPEPPSRAALDYAPFYCEENIWRLLGRPEFGRLPAWALLISSLLGGTRICAQRLGKGSRCAVDWDYHVVALAVPVGGAPEILDFDTRLGFPVSASEWLAASFPRDLKARTVRGREPAFRLIPAGEYVRCLSSDRSHMRGPDGTWLAPPPPWPAPGGGHASNLLAWLDLRRAGPGALLNLAELGSFIAGSAPGIAGLGPCGAESSSLQ